MRGLELAPHDGGLTGGYVGCAPGADPGGDWVEIPSWHPLQGRRAKACIACHPQCPFFSKLNKSAPGHRISCTGCFCKEPSSVQANARAEHSLSARARSLLEASVAERRHLLAEASAPPNPSHSCSVSPEGGARLLQHQPSALLAPPEFPSFRTLRVTSLLVSTPFLNENPQYLHVNCSLGCPPTPSLAEIPLRFLQR